LTTAYTYDAFDRLIQQDSPDTGITQFGYDAAGNRLRQTDARGVTSYYSYDALNRLTFIDYPDDSQDVTYNYDSCTNGLGRLCQMVDAAGTTDYDYDARGNLASQTVTLDSFSYTTRYTYNAADQLIQMTYPSGRIVDYSRNVLGQIAGVTMTHNAMMETVSSSMIYLPFGPMNAMTYGNALSHTRSYDLDYRLTQLQTFNSSPYQDRQYSYDNANNITDISNMVDSSRSQSLLYDSLNRLFDATGNYGNINYSYDHIGNRLTEVDDGVFESYSYGIANHHLEQTVASGITNYSYDANGNTTSNNQFDFSYGDNNRLQSVSMGAASIAEYTYNGRGERVKKLGLNTTYYHYDLNG